MAVQTDYELLVMIAYKPLSDVSKCLQRMLIRLEKYDYELVYHPGSQIVIKNTLSQMQNDGGSPRISSVLKIEWSSMKKEDLIKI